MIGTSQVREKQREIAQALVEAFDSAEPLRLTPLPPELFLPDSIPLYEWPAQPENPPPRPPDHLLSDVRNARAHSNAGGIRAIALGRRKDWGRSAGPISAPASVLVPGE